MLFAASGITRLSPGSSIQTGTELPESRRPRADDLRSRPARADDLAWLCALERQSFATDRISRRSFRRFLKSGTCSLIVAELGGARAGYALLLKRAGSRIARIYSIAVEPSARGRGAGAALVEACGEQARQSGCETLRLEVREKDRGAVRFYQRLGFELFERREGYYQDGAAALRMQKALAAGRRARDEEVR